MENGRYSGEYEDNFLNLYVVEDEAGIEINTNVKAVPKRGVMNSRTTTKSYWSAVRNEVVLSCKEIPSQTLYEDQKHFIDRINTFIDGRSYQQKLFKQYILILKIYLGYIQFLHLRMML